jgi:hypothetical protein
MKKVVPTPTKKMHAFEAMTGSPVIETNAEISEYVPVREKLVKQSRETRTPVRITAVTYGPIGIKHPLPGAVATGLHHLT